MKKLLTRNLGLKLASLLLAFVLWFLVAQIYDPKDTVTFNNIQVRLINTELLDEEGKVYEVLDNSNLVRVTVTGPQSIVKSELRRSDIVAEADMSKLTDINTIAITYYCENISNDSVEIKGNHDSVRLNVEDKTSKWIKLESNTIGDVASGYMIGNVTLDQTNIEVTGPKSAISQVDHAGVDINVTDSTTSLSANVDIKLYDSDDLGLPSDGKQAQKAGMAGVQRSIPESALLSTVQGHGAKNYYQKRQPDHPGVGVYAAIYPFSAYGKAGVRPHCSAKWNTEKPHDRPRESLYPGTCFVGRAWTPGLVR